MFKIAIAGIALADPAPTRQLGRRPRNPFSRKPKPGHGSGSHGAVAPVHPATGGHGGAHAEKPIHPNTPHEGAGPHPNPNNGGAHLNNEGAHLNSGGRKPSRNPLSSNRKEKAPKNPEGKKLGKKVMGGLVTVPMIMVTPSFFGVHGEGYYGNTVTDMWAQMFHLGKYDMTRDPETGLKVYDLTSGKLGHMVGEDSQKDPCGNYVDPDWMAMLGAEEKGMYTERGWRGARCLSKWVKGGHGTNGWQAGPGMMGCSNVVTSSLCETNPDMCGIFEGERPGGGIESDFFDCHGNYVDFAADMMSDAGMNNVPMVTVEQRWPNSDTGRQLITAVPRSEDTMVVNPPTFINESDMQCSEATVQSVCDDDCLEDTDYNTTLCCKSVPMVIGKGRNACETFTRTPKPCSVNRDGTFWDNLKLCYEPMSEERTLQMWKGYVGNTDGSKFDPEGWTAIFYPEALKHGGNVALNEAIYSMKQVFFPEEWAFIEKECMPSGDQDIKYQMFEMWPTIGRCKNFEDWKAEDAAEKPEGGISPVPVEPSGPNPWDPVEPAPVDPWAPAGGGSDPWGSGGDDIWGNPGGPVDPWAPNPEAEKPVDPWAPVEPVDPWAPVEPANPWDPVAPEPVAPANPWDPVAPADPWAVAPADPVDPWAPVDHGGSDGGSDPWGAGGDPWGAGGDPW